MYKITLSEAQELVDVIRSKLYQNASAVTISTDKNKQGKKFVDITELERAQGNITNNTAISTTGKGSF